MSLTQLILFHLLFSLLLINNPIPTNGQSWKGLRDYFASLFPKTTRRYTLISNGAHGPADNGGELPKIIPPRNPGSILPESWVPSNAEFLFNRNSQGGYFGRSERSASVDSPQGAPYNHFPQEQADEGTLDYSDIITAPRKLKEEEVFQKEIKLTSSMSFN